jgi:DNA-binding response OmpR family regulator
MSDDAEGITPSPKTFRILVAWRGNGIIGALVIRRILQSARVSAELVNAVCPDDELAGLAAGGQWDILVVEPASPPLLQMLRKEGVQIPILALCGWSEHHFAAALDAGATQVIGLPFNLREFVRELMRLGGQT